MVALSDAPMDYRDRYQRLTGVPHCGRGQMVRIESFLAGTLPRGPPADTS
ncbi:transposase [Polaromonas sp. JS666]|nr:transposase [Polaromonas sp. JS666]